MSNTPKYLTPPIPTVRFSSSNPPARSTTPSSHYASTSHTASPSDSDSENNPKQPLLPLPVSSKSPSSFSSSSSSSSRRSKPPTQSPLRYTLENASLVLSLLFLGALFSIIIIGNKTTPATTDPPDPNGPKLGGAEKVVRAEHGVVSSDVKRCSDIGIDVLRDGGNAVDAVIATGACIGTVNMFASGIGGGGFMLVSMSNGTTVNFNFRERAPAASSRDMFVDRYESARVGGLAVGVPGELSGMREAHKWFGGIEWGRLWTPSVEIAEKGFEVSKAFRKILGQGEEWLLGLGEEERIGWEFLLRNSTDGRGARLVDEGEKITRPNFAATLKEIAGPGYEGVESFYSGPLSKRIISTVNSAGGDFTAHDLGSYFTAITPPISTTFHGYEVLTCPPPCSGLVLLEGLNIIEGLPMFDSADPLTSHYIAEAMKHLSAGRTELGDPADPIAAENSRVRLLLDKAHAAEIRANISAAKTYPWQHYNPSFEPNEVHGTSHIEAVDQWGNAASFTSTINLYWGARVIDPETGIIFNNQMDDFSTPGHPNSFHLRPSIYNFPEPGKRPLSSSAPTIILPPPSSSPSWLSRSKGTSPLPLLVLGASGGSHILTAIFEAVVKKLIWRYSLLDTIRSPRIHHQLLPDIVQVEVGTRKEVVEGLEERGHKVVVGARGEVAGGSVVHGIWRVGGDEKGGFGGAKGWEGLADWWRKGGEASGY